MAQLSTIHAKLYATLSKDTVGGLLLLAAAILGFFLANSPWADFYQNLSQTKIGPENLHLHLSASTWAADGMLAIFFFIVGLELKYEVVAGNLRDIRQAAVPVLAAVGGMVTPALVFLLVINLTGDPGAAHGWAIPTATDIAFAVSVLAIFGRGLPQGLRLFLLTLAVVDDLLAIIVIAVAFTASIDFVALGISLLFVILFALISRGPKKLWWLLVPVALAAWAFMHTSGVHATIAGVLMGLSVPAKSIRGEAEPRTHTFEYALQPLSAGIILPVFAFFAAGVAINGGDTFSYQAFLGVMLGLMVGKIVGVLGTTFLLTRFTGLRLPDAIGIRDLLPVGFLTGIGFTVSLLITELAFTDGPHTAGAKLGVLVGTLGSGVLAALLLEWDRRNIRGTDMNEDGVADQDLRKIGD